MAKVVFLGPGEGRQLVLGTNTVTFKAVTDDTEGRFSVMESRIDAHGPHPPVHVHDQLDHAIYVLEGTVVLTVEQRQLTAPAGFERYFERLAEAVPAGSQIDPATMAALQAEHDTHPPRP
jgi:hypothetical protein